MIRASRTWPFDKQINLNRRSRHLRWTINEGISCMIAESAGATVGDCLLLVMYGLFDRYLKADSGWCLCTVTQQTCTGSIRWSTRLGKRYGAMYRFRLGRLLKFLGLIRLVVSSIMWCLAFVDMIWIGWYCGGWEYFCYARLDGCGNYSWRKLYRDMIKTIIDWSQH